jgi:hypothetical protein
LLGQFHRAGARGEYRLRVGDVGDLPYARSQCLGEHVEVEVLAEQDDAERGSGQPVRGRERDHLRQRYGGAADHEYLTGCVGDGAGQIVHSGHMADTVAEEQGEVLGVLRQRFVQDGHRRLPWCITRTARRYRRRDRA